MSIKTFYHRCLPAMLMAAGELGRVSQEIADLQTAGKYRQTGSPEYARMLRSLAYAES